MPNDLAALAYFDIQATKQYTSVTVRLAYDASTISQQQAQFLQMWVWNGTEWNNITTRVDTVNNVIYGLSPHLSMFGITSLQPLPEGITTLGATCSKTVVGKGYGITINIPIQNKEIFAQSFQLIVYANSTVIYTQQITDIPPGQTNITFTLGTANRAYGTYAISACDQLISWITITIPGDVTGDFFVNPADLGVIAANWKKHIIL